MKLTDLSMVAENCHLLLPYACYSGRGGQPGWRTPPRGRWPRSWKATPRDSTWPKKWVCLQKWERNWVSEQMQIHPRNGFKLIKIPVEICLLTLFAKHPRSRIFASKMSHVHSVGFVFIMKTRFARTARTNENLWAIFKHCTSCLYFTRYSGISS